MKSLTAAFALLWAVTSFGGEWIWSPAELPERNSYVEFRRGFQGDGRPVTLRVAAGGEVLEIPELQAPGKKRMKAADYLNGHGITLPARFEG